MARDNDWDEMHGYVHMRCPKCGWSGKTDGCAPECGCYDEDGDAEPELGICRTTTQIARKAYMVGTKWEIRQGDRYSKTVRREYLPGGEWLNWQTGRTLLDKGPAWNEHTVEPKPFDWGLPLGEAQ